MAVQDNTTKNSYKSSHSWRRGGIGSLVSGGLFRGWSGAVRAGLLGGLFTGCGVGGLSTACLRRAFVGASQFVHPLYEYKYSINIYKCMCSLRDKLINRNCSILDAEHRSRDCEQIRGSREMPHGLRDPYSARSNWGDALKICV